ncbi:MAG TPA: glycerol-3-phosphate dehydrogenase/oxidase [Chitinophagaceae bacterium]|nr:glycerol-3-phosphate dehydrogenase/oxidase [Chitinophagaceae bacterium]
MNREAALERIKTTTEWEVLVIGGGASGLGIALESASRGYTTLLAEQADFAKSTSSKSTKLVHGGVRYLAQGNIALVREASIERGLLSKNAPHLVKNQTFIVPVYTRWSSLKYTLGLKLYDWISGKLSLGKSVFISRRETLEKLPGINSKKLHGGVLYHDGQFDDARLAINLAQTIFEKGGIAINYMKVEGLLKEGEKVCGVKAADVESGERFLIRSKTVINATGVFTDNILQMDSPAAKRTISASQGVHLVVDRKFFPGDNALMIPETSDGRVLFIVPWHNKLLMGTTDTPVKAISAEPAATQTEIDFILNTAKDYLTVPPARKDVLSVFAGLRPLAAPEEEGKNTKEISRSHQIIVSGSGLFSMLGGKWTTYRKMGEDMMNEVEKRMQWKHVASVTGLLHIHGYTTPADMSDALNFYGSDEKPLKNILTGEDISISEKFELKKSQVIWAIREEMARTVEDVLSRRTRCLLLDARESIRVAPRVAEMMAGEMNKDEDWTKRQIDDFNFVAKNYVL